MIHLFSCLFKDFNSDRTKIFVYFVDSGHQESISIENIRHLPSEFTRQPAFAIPCRLYQICPLNSNERLPWKNNDPVRDQFNLLMDSNAICKVCNIRDQTCYDIEIEFPGKFLFLFQGIISLYIFTLHRSK